MDRLFPSRAVLFPTRIVLAASLVFLGSPHPNARPVPLTGGRLTATTMACDDDGCRSASSAPPDTQGYFHLLPVGSWSSLPSGKRCKDLVH